MQYFLKFQSFFIFDFHTAEQIMTKKLYTFYLYYG
jgi:hypothetical protein